MNRRDLRTFAILVHLFAISIMAFPSASGGMKRSAWNDPTVKEEFQAWNGRLSVLGWTGDVDALQDRAWEVVSAYERTRGTVLAPFQPYYRYCGTWQSWRMFVAPHRYPGRLHIDLLEGDTWRAIYQARSTTYTWHAQQLDHDRMRSAIFRYAWPAYKAGYAAFTRWIAVQARQDFPEATQVRVRFYRFRTPSPEEVKESREPEGRFVHTRTVAL